MDNIYAWAKRWNVPEAAIDELRRNVGMEGTTPTPGATSESGVQSRVRLQYAERGDALWRNNVGVLEDRNGRPVRFGLANESSKMNQNIKSSDLIGITRVRIEPCHVGQVMGVFTAIETKHPKWKYAGTAHEKAQLNYIGLVRTLGGIGYFTT